MGLMTFEGMALSTEEVRKRLLHFEAVLADEPGAFFGDAVQCPLKHSFGDGTYMREIFIPAGVVLTGKIHRTTHPYTLLAGEALVFTEDVGWVHLLAPLAGISPAGVKRLVVALKDLWWITHHGNPDNCRDLAVLEERLIAKSYEELAT